MPFLFRSYQGKSQWANQDLLIPSSLPIIDFTTFNSATNVANTGTSVLFGGSALTMSNYDYITTSPQKFTSVAVNSQQTRMIIATYYGAWYSTSTDAGANWTIPTQIPGTPTPVTPFAENGDQSVSCAMSADGTKASINGKMKNNNVFYSIYWGYSNSSPTATLITNTIPSITYPSATMAFNGNVVLLGGMSSSNLQYAVWNSSTNQYGSLQNLKYSDGVTNVVQIDMFYMANTFSQDGSILFNSRHDGQSSVKYISLTWSSQYVPSTSQTSWNTINIANSVALGSNAQVTCLLGGNSKTPSTILAAITYKSSIKLFNVNIANKTITYVGGTAVGGIASIAGDYPTLGLTPAGTNGNILYYPTTTGINRVTINVA